MVEKPTIREFFCGRSVFVTGATGFIGKILLEKLLRSCPDIDTIYILMRGKKDKNISQRFKDMTEIPLFDVLKNQNPDALEKLKPVSGDVMELGLGLSDEDRRVLEERVSVVFHFAASVRFNDSLKKSTILNVCGTRETLNLAVNMKNIKVFLHVSTAFCNLEQKTVNEVLYPIDILPQDMIGAVEKIDDKTLKVITPKILGQYFPNTYTFGKRLAEQLVDEFKEIMPVIIARPSITVNTRKEPIPGWIDTLMGPVGLIQAAVKGVIHVSYMNPKIRMDYVSGDGVVNAIIISAWKKATDSWLKDCSVYHLTGCDSKNVPAGAVLEVGLDVLRDVPSTKAIYYPSGFVTESPVVFYISMMFLHILPALFIDFALKIYGKEPRVLDIQRRIYVAMIALQHFMFNEWDFLNTNMMNLENYLSESDFKEFKYYYEDLDPAAYLKDLITGSNKYLVKESEEMVEAAKRHFARLKVIHYIVKTTSTLLFIWFFFTLSKYAFHSIF